MTDDPNADVLHAIARLADEVASLRSMVANGFAMTNERVDSLRGDIAGLAREIIEAGDRSVREAEGRLRADADQRRDELSRRIADRDDRSG